MLRLQTSVITKKVAKQKFSLMGFLYQLFAKTLADHYLPYLMDVSRVYEEFEGDRTVIYTNLYRYKQNTTILYADLQSCAIFSQNS